MGYVWQEEDKNSAGNGADHQTKAEPNIHRKLKMGDRERRKHPRHEIEIGVTIHKKGEKDSAAMINISRGGIGVIADRKILIGEKVNITLDCFGGFAIQGTTRWEELTTKEGRTIYRIGIEADPAIASEDLWKDVLP
ncbi:MAG: PilZ domain-containing protein [Sedimentisphaerales bacterium]|nr:PilZ domain-containing protein [Sedimentisphaerales bacterium]